MAIFSPIVGAILPTRGKLAFRNQRSPSHVHQGIDIAARVGTPVRSVANGVVTHAFERLGPGFGGHGRLVVVKMSGNRWALYSHLDQVLVVVGQRVRRGDTIATVGKTCFRRSDPTAICTKGAHVHFEVSPRPYPQGPEEPRVDPIAFLQSQGGVATGLVLAALAGGGYLLWRRLR